MVPKSVRYGAYRKNEIQPIQHNTAGRLLGIETQVAKRIFYLMPPKRPAELNSSATPATACNARTLSRHEATLSALRRSRTMRTHIGPARILPKNAVPSASRVLPNTTAPIKEHAARFSQTVLSIVRLHDNSNTLTSTAGKPPNLTLKVKTQADQTLGGPFSPYKVAMYLRPRTAPMTPRTSRSLRPLRIMPRMPSQRRPKTSAGEGGVARATASTDEVAEVKFANIEARGWTVDTTPIGEGSFGTVHLCSSSYNATKTAKKRVCKAVRLPTSHDREEFRREVRMLRACGEHKHICRIVDVAEDTRFGYLVLQSCTGGELFDRINSRKLDECEAAMACTDVLSALSFLRAKRIVHRDIKPENLMYKDMKPGSPLLLIDFGFATQLEYESRRLTEICGTAAYMAPEVLRGDYSLACDMWSLGVVAHVILAGKLPFNGRNDDEKEARILRHTDLSFAGARTWGTVSDAAKDFIQKLLNPDEHTRMGTRAALQHPWIKMSLARGAPAAQTHPCASSSNPTWMDKVLQSVQCSPRSRISPLISAAPHTVKAC